jgi:hypothetical protein
VTSPILHIVHTIDTEGPLDEDLPATFKRVSDLFGVDLEPTRDNLGRLQRCELDLGGVEDKVAAVVAPQLLNYNRNWHQVQAMLDEAMSPAFRRAMVDDFGGGWVYSWHCVDHLGFTSNPRHKDLGYGNVFRHYRQAIRETGSHDDELNWHFHPLSLTRSPLAAATSYVNSLDVLLQVWCRRIIEDKWFPTTNRPGFHSERPDAHLFMEQWLPFDYANQAISEPPTGQRDTLAGRFGDWSRAPQDWIGYHPDLHDYQQAGHCRRWIFRCLNIGTRFRLLGQHHLREAFEDARRHGSAIVAFSDHDYRDLRPDVDTMREMLAAVRPDYDDVRIKFSGAHAAACAHVAVMEPDGALPPPRLALAMEGSCVTVRLLEGRLLGSQPFLAIKTRSGAYYHDNFDVIVPERQWSYVLDDQTLPTSAIEVVGVGGAGAAGHFAVETLSLV